ncbi:MAG: DUF502 domain-containing protein [Pseudomonadales bacterium]
MQRFKTFITLTFLGGIVVILPVALLLLIFQWLLRFVSDLLTPISLVIIDVTGWQDGVAELVALLAIFASCFFIGLFLKTRVGVWMHDRLDGVLSRYAPGYKSIRELVVQLLGGSGETSLFSGEVALAKIYGPDSPITVTAIVTSKHDNGYFTVYVPTAPIPTSGITYHVPASCVELLPHVSVEQAMRTIVACGSGSAELLQAGHR